MKKKVWSEKWEIESVLPNIKNAINVFENQYFWEKTIENAQVWRKNVCFHPSPPPPPQNSTIQKYTKQHVLTIITVVKKKILWICISPHIIASILLTKKKVKKKGYWEKKIATRSVELKSKP